jgi:hypothetical protein
MPFRIADGFQCACNFESSFNCEFCITRSSDTGNIWGLAGGSVAHAAASTETGGSKLEVEDAGPCGGRHITEVLSNIHSTTPQCTVLCSTDLISKSDAQIWRVGGGHGTPSIRGPAMCCLTSISTAPVTHRVHE